MKSLHSVAWALLALVACARVPTAPEPGGEGVSTSPQAASPVRFVGRVDTSDPHGPRFAWSGTTVAARFSGKAIDCRLHDEGGNTFEVLVDGVPTGAIQTGPTRDEYTLANGLAEGTHEVALYRRTEARHGEVQFLGFVPQGGSLLPGLPPPVSSRRIELIGDSITVGYGVEGAGPICPPATNTENEFVAYGALAARALGAEHVAVGWSGKTVEEMSALYERTLPGRADSRWDFASWTPDAVVINLGTNDFTRGDPGQLTFTRPYLALVERVRARYPTARIVCLVGTMLSDAYPPGARALTHARAYIKAVVERLRAKGDSKIAFLEIASQDPADGYGCDYHPSVKTQKRMADELVAALRAQMGW